MNSENNEQEIFLDSCKKIANILVDATLNGKSADPKYFYLLQHALRYYKNGNLNEAKSLYQTIKNELGLTSEVPDFFRLYQQQEKFR